MLAEASDGRAESGPSVVGSESAAAGLFTTAVTEETLQAARERSQNQIFGSSQVFQQSKGSTEGQHAFSLPHIVRSRVSQHYEAGLSFLSREEAEEAVLSFSKAINLRPEQVELYVKRAEAFLYLCDFQSAALNLRKACSISSLSDEYLSLLAFTLYLQGQCLFDQESYLGALESFTSASELQPWKPLYNFRSIACLAALGRHADCLRLVSKLLEDDKRNPDLHVLRARLHFHFSKVTLCYQDVQEALQLDSAHTAAQALKHHLETQAKEAKAQAVNRAVEGKLPEALSKICFAIEHHPAQAEYYAFRGALYRRLQDFSSAMDDLVLSMQLSGAGEGTPVFSEAQKQLLLTYNDFAVHCYTRGFYQEGVLLLNKALKGQKCEMGLYMNRGDCLFRLGELTLALADYQQALDLSPLDSGVRSRIAMLQNELGLQEQKCRRYQEAESCFSRAIESQPSLACCYLHRARVRQFLQDQMGAQEDALIFLQLDLNSTEVEPLIMGFFPGKSLQEVLSSELCAAAKGILERNLQACAPFQPLDNTKRGEQEGMDPVSREAEDLRKGGPCLGSAVARCVSKQEVYTEVVHNRKRISQEIQRVLQPKGGLKLSAVKTGKAVQPPKAEAPPDAPYRWKMSGLTLGHH